MERQRRGVRDPRGRWRRHLDRKQRQLEQPRQRHGRPADGGYAIFTGAAGTVTVDGGAGPVRVSGIQFASDRYRLQGAPITLVGNGNQPVIVVGDGTYASAQYVNTIANPLQGTQGLRQDRPAR